MTDSHSKLWASRERTPEILVERQIPEPDSSSPESQLLGIESRKLHFQIRLIWGRFVVVHSLNCVQLCVTPWIAACQDSLSFTISQSLLRLKFIELMLPSNHLILSCPLLLQPLIFPTIRVFSNESPLHIKWPKYWSFSISPSNEYSGLIFFRIDWFYLLAVKGLSRVFSSTTVQKRQFFGAQPSLWSNSHIHT